MTEVKNIVIAGAGFAGITAARKLAKKLKNLPGYRLILIDCRNYQLYTPALYEIASIPQEYASDAVLKSSIVLPIAEIIRKVPITFLHDTLVGLKPREKKIVLEKKGELPYECLVFALGSETNYFAIPGLKERSFPLKTFHDAVRLRNAIENIFKKDNGIKIIVGGAGASGVELIAEFVNFLCALKEKITASKACRAQFVLVEASAEILPGFEPWIAKKARQRLEKLGVRIKTGAVVSAVEEKELVYKNGVREPYDILIWTGGVKGPETLQKFGLPLSPKGAVIIDEFLRAEGLEDSIFAIGDNAQFTNPKTGRPLVWNVPVAEAEGRLAAENILHRLQGKPLKKFVPKKKYPYILAVGEKYAIADLVLVRFSGFWGWVAKELVELRYLLSVLPLIKACRISGRGIKIFSSND